VKRCCTTSDLARAWLGCAALLLISIAAGRAEPLPDWWNSTIGTAPIVLPGFEPVEVAGTTVALGGRRYVWTDGYLPARLESLGRPLTGALRLVSRTGGGRQELKAASVRIASSAPDHAVVVAEGEALPGVRVVAPTRVEYDGVAMVAIELVPAAPVSLDGLDFEVDVERTPAMRMLRFDADTVRYQPRKQSVDLRSYAGRFWNVVAFPDGERSFWWFADNADGWIWNAPVVTEVEALPQRVTLRQRLIGTTWRIAAPMRFDFNFLATPVRDLGTAWRKDLRVVATADARHAGLGKLHLWWGGAFAHVNLPYTEYPPGVEARLPAADRRAYAGADGSRRLLKKFEQMGITRIPYFSTHCLSELDPVLQRYRSDWEIQPPLVARGGLSGMDADVKHPCLSQRTRPFANYLLSRFAVEMPRNGAKGLYFDQASVLDSRNPKSGAWVDSNGRTQGSTDILAIREFHKRLRVLFHEQGIPGYVFVHNSNSEIIPAYTFVTATVDGEQLREHLEGSDDTIAKMPLDMVRAQLAPAQYGVLAVWLPQSFTVHAKDATWEGSSGQGLAFRNFMTLALLHDIPVSPTGFPLEGWRSLLRELDAFGLEKARFVGYWAPSPAVRTATPDAQVSYYERDGSLLLVVANLAPESREIALEALRPGGGVPATVRVPGRDFALVRVEKPE
jgi:hypothetical protein